MYYLFCTSSWLSIVYNNNFFEMYIQYDEPYDKS